MKPLKQSFAMGNSLEELPVEPWTVESTADIPGSEHLRPSQNNLVGLLNCVHKETLSFFFTIKNSISVAPREEEQAIFCDPPPLLHDLYCEQI